MIPTLRKVKQSNSRDDSAGGSARPAYAGLNVDEELWYRPPPSSPRSDPINLPGGSAPQSSSRNMEQLMTELSRQASVISSQQLPRPTDEEAARMDLPTLLERKSWRQVLDRIRTNPREARNLQKLSLYGKSGDESRALPIHLAMALNPPTMVVEALVKAYPEGARMADGKWGRLPLHIGCIDCAGMNALTVLINAFPDGVRYKDKIAGRLPLHYACIWATSQEVTMLLKAYPNALHKKDSGGNTPLALATNSGNPNKTQIVEKLQKMILESSKASPTGSSFRSESGETEGHAGMRRDDRAGQKESVSVARLPTSRANEGPSIPPPQLVPGKHVDRNTLLDEDNNAIASPFCSSGPDNQNIGLSTFGRDGKAASFTSRNLSTRPSIVPDDRRVSSYGEDWLHHSGRHLGHHEESAKKRISVSDMDGFENWSAIARSTAEMSPDDRKPPAREVPAGKRRESKGNRQHLPVLRDDSDSRSTQKSASKGERTSKNVKASTYPVDLNYFDSWSALAAAGEIGSGERKRHATKYAERHKDDKHHGEGTRSDKAHTDRPGTSDESRHSDHMSESEPGRKNVEHTDAGDVDVDSLTSQYESERMILSNKLLDIQEVEREIQLLEQQRDVLSHECTAFTKNVSQKEQKVVEVKDKISGLMAQIKVLKDKIIKEETQLALAMRSLKMHEEMLEDHDKKMEKIQRQKMGLVKKKQSLLEECSRQTRKVSDMNAEIKSLVAIKNMTREAGDGAEKHSR